MRLLDQLDVLAVGARVLGCDVRVLADRVDLEELGLAVEGMRAGADSDLPLAAAMLVEGLIQRRPFPERNRRIAVAAMLYLLADNDCDLALDGVDLNLVLDGVAAGTLSAPYFAGQVRGLIRPRTETVFPPRSADVDPDGPTPEGAAPEGAAPEVPAATFARPGTTPGMEETMFERFTDRARRVVVLGQEEARNLNHNYIGTEHLLLGLIREGQGVAAKTLEQLEVSLEEVRIRVKEIIGQGREQPTGHIPFTPRAKQVLELSLREAMQFGHTYIGTEHILLGLVREGEGVAAQVLVNLGAEPERVREEVNKILAGAPGEEGPAASLGSTGARGRMLMRELTAFLDENERLHTEVVRLRELLRRHGIDPDEPAASAGEARPEGDVRPEDETDDEEGTADG